MSTFTHLREDVTQQLTQSSALFFLVGLK